MRLLLDVVLRADGDDSIWPAKRLADAMEVTIIGERRQFVAECDDLRGDALLTLTTEQLAEMAKNFRLGPTATQVKEIRIGVLHGAGL